MQKSNSLVIEALVTLRCSYRALKNLLKTHIWYVGKFREFGLHGGKKTCDEYK